MRPLRPTDNIYTPSPVEDRCDICGGLVEVYYTVWGHVGELPDHLPTVRGYTNPLLDKQYRRSLRSSV